MEFSVSASDVMAALTLGLAIYIAWHQRALGTSQKHLNDFLLKQGKEEVLNARKADLRAKFIRPDPHKKYHLEIRNKGKGTARNVRIEFPEGDDLVLESDVDCKFPLEVLAPDKAVELVALIGCGRGNKQLIKLIWDDDSGKNNEISSYPTIYS